MTDDEPPTVEVQFTAEQWLAFVAATDAALRKVDRLVNDELIPARRALTVSGDSGPVNSYLAALDHVPTVLDEAAKDFTKALRRLAGLDPA